MTDMFTLEQIDKIHERFGNADTLAQYLQALHSIGVNRYDSYITDGHSKYFGDNGQEIVSEAVHEVFVIAEKSDRERFMKCLNLSRLGKLGYIEMSKGFADSGIEKWTFDTHKMTITYSDKAGNEILVEDIT